MNFLKYSTCRFAVLLLLAQEALAGGSSNSYTRNQMCAMYCERSQDVHWGSNYVGNGVWPCVVSGPSCTITRVCSTTTFSDWEDFVGMYSFRVKCNAGNSIGLCSYASPTWQRLDWCADGEEAAGFCIGDSQRRRLKGGSKKKGEPVYQEGSQMEVEIDGVAMVILDAKERE